MLRVDQLVTSLDKQPNPISGQLNAGQVACVLGRNGAGKSWLLRSVAGLNAVRSGGIKGLEDQPQARWCGYLAQTESRLFPMRVKDYVLSARHPWLAWHQDYQPLDYEYVESALARMGLADKANTSIQALSGGEWQRVRLAALIAQQAKVWLLDEPIEHLDPGHIWSTLPDLIRDHQANGGCVLMVAHDPDWAAQCSDQVLLLDAEQWSWAEAKEQLTQSKLSQLYGHPYECRDGRWFAV